MDGNRFCRCLSRAFCNELIWVSKNNIYHDFTCSAQPYLYISQKSFMALNIIKANSIFEWPIALLPSGSTFVGSS